MTYRLGAALLLIAASALPAHAQLGPRATLSLAPESKLWVEGTSTVRSYRCEAEDVKAAVTASSAAISIDRLRGDVTNASLTVEAGALDCNNGTMNGHMRKALKADAHPRIEFRLGSIDAVPGVATVSGDLTLAGVTQPITMTGDLVQENGALRLRGTYELRMTEYGISPPRLMAGTMRVHDPVKINFDLVFRP